MVTGAPGSPAPRRGRAGRSSPCFPIRAGRRAPSTPCRRTSCGRTTNPARQHVGLPGGGLGEQPGRGGRIGIRRILIEEEGPAIPQQLAEEGVRLGERERAILLQRHGLLHLRGASGWPGSHPCGS